MVTSDANSWVADRQHLGQITTINDLEYGWILPGGSNTMKCLALEDPRRWRPRAIELGRRVRLYRGSSWIWSGKLLAPSPAADDSGVQLAAQGIGTFGSNLLSIFSSWDQNTPLDQAIIRGLPWLKDSLSSSGLWLGQAQDSGVQFIVDFLNLITGGGGQTWKVVPTGSVAAGAADKLTIFPFPTTNPGDERLILVSLKPVGRVINDVNSLWARYQATADNTNTGAKASYALTNAQVPASIAAHGVQEQPFDLTGGGLMSGGTAGAAASAVLTKYQPSKFDGAWTINQGDLLTAGGVEVDIGLDYTGQVAKIAEMDASYGGEAGRPGAVRVVCGQYDYSEKTGSGTFGAYQMAVTDLPGMLQAVASALTPQTPS